MALLEARAFGFRHAVLGSSPRGHGVYLHLGFEEVCRIELYQWTPD